MENWWSKYVGKEFEEKGRGADTFDCWGLLRWIYKHDHPLALDVPSYDECYKNTQATEELSKIMSHVRDESWVEVKEPKEFDAILINMKGVPMHVAVVTKKGYMIHCSKGVGTSHEKFESMRWKHKIVGFFRYE